MMRKARGKRTPLEKQLAALAYRQVQYEFDHLKLKGAEKKQVRGAGQGAGQVRRAQAEAADAGTDGARCRPRGAADAHPQEIRRPAIEPGFLTILDETRAAITPPPALTSTGRRWRWPIG